jgi:hypothetical protein
MQDNSWMQSVSKVKLSREANRRQGHKTHGNDLTTIFLFKRSHSLSFSSTVTIKIIVTFSLALASCFLAELGRYDVNKLLFPYCWPLP